MPFPEVARVIYKKNPLVNVICQYRFPPILKIDSEVPSIFQEKIRNKFPLYIEKREFFQQFAPAEAPNIVNQLLTKQSTVKNFEFLSEDSIWKVNLTRTSITLSTSKYEKWESFIENFSFVLNSFIETYSPPFFTRIGLRYIDVFKRSVLELTDSNWSELIKPEFLGLLSSSFAEKIVNFESVYVIKLTDDASIVRMKLSIAKELMNGENCFVIDSDFNNSQKKQPSEASETLEFLHERASRLIRYIIQDKLHEAMNPEKL